MGSASVIKVVITEELLHRTGLGEIELGTSELARMETMLIDSDDSAASSLYRQFGGVSLIEAALSRHELKESGPPANPRYWGNTMITAHDVAKFYDNVLSGSIPVERHRVTRAGAVVTEQTPDERVYNGSPQIPSIDLGYLRPPDYAGQDDLPNQEQQIAGGILSEYGLSADQLPIEVHYIRAPARRPGRVRGPLRTHGHLRLRSRPDPSRVDRAVAGKRGP